MFTVHAMIPNSLQYFAQPFFYIFLIHIIGVGIKNKTGIHFKLTNKEHQCYHHVRSWNWAKGNHAVGPKKF